MVYPTHGLHFTHWGLSQIQVLETGRSFANWTIEQGNVTLGRIGRALASLRSSASA